MPLHPLNPLRRRYYTPLGIINIDFDAGGQLLIKYSALIKYLREKNGNTMKQCISY